MDIDHVVSLKDAYDSGARWWTDMEKERFANDKENHVEACAAVNRSKSDATPREFLERSKDGKGREYNIVNWCGYVAKYYHVKQKYNLSTDMNDKQFLVQCDSKAKYQAAEASEVSSDKVSGESPMEWAVAKCDLIGFGKSNPKHFNCVVNLMELLD